MQYLVKMEADISHFDKQIAGNITVDVPAHQIVDTVKITKLEQEQATILAQVCRWKPRALITKLTDVFTRSGLGEQSRRS